MGQGTDSCGGWDDVYDPYEENLGTGVWTSQEGDVHVSKMTTKHLKAAKRRCEMLAATASYTSEQQKWEDWVSIFEEELDKRDLVEVKSKPVHCARPKATTVVPYKPRGTKIKMVCFCGSTYEARLADLKRGWGLTCSKRCAAIRREFGRPAAKEVGTGFNVKQILWAQK